MGEAFRSNLMSDGAFVEYNFLGEIYNLGLVRLSRGESFPTALIRPPLVDGIRLLIRQMMRILLSIDSETLTRLGTNFVVLEVKRRVVGNKHPGPFLILAQFELVSQHKPRETVVQPQYRLPLKPVD